MNRRSYRFVSASLLAAVAWLGAGSALANGRFPAADQLIINPLDPLHIVIRTTFGFVESRDGGKKWAWTCEDIIGRIASFDPPFAVNGDGSVVVAVPFEGVSVTHDHGCTWARAPEPLAGQLAVDVTLAPNDPATILVLTSTNDTPPDAGPTAPPEFLNLVVETKDNAVTWALRGAPLARDFIAGTIEIAASDPDRLYTSGVFGDPLQGGIERSEDGGKTWIRTLVPTGRDLGGVYISAVDAKNADRLFVRVLAQPDPLTNATPTTLLASTDKGTTWKELAKTDEAMLGFALSPDGAKLVYGTIGQGVFLGPSDGSAPFEKVSSIQNRCLTWSAAGLYACGTDLGPPPPETFAVGLSHDMGRTFETLFKLSQTCPAVCPDDSRFNSVCRMVWELKPGVTAATGATGLTCTVDWAKTAAPDGGSGSDAGKEEAGTGGGKDAGNDPGQREPTPGNSCACRVAALASTGPAHVGTAGFTLLGGVLFARRKRRVRVPSRR